MSRDIILEKASAARELFVVIENALEAINRHPERAHPLTASEIILREARLKYLKLFRSGLTITGHRDLSGIEGSGYCTVYTLSDGSLLLCPWKTTRRFDSEFRLRNDRARMIRRGISEEAINAYFQSVVGK